MRCAFVILHFDGAAYGGSSTSAAVSALSSRVKATLIVSTFPSQGDRRRVRQWFEGELSYKNSRHFGGLKPEGDILALSPAFSTREMRARFDLRRDRRPEPKSPSTARAAGARHLAGRRLERGLQAVSRHEQLCGFRRLHPQRDFFRGHSDQSRISRFALSGRTAPSSRSRLT